MPSIGTVSRPMSKEELDLIKRLFPKVTGDF